MAINDEEVRWLVVTEGVPTSQYNEAWYLWLESQGMTGAYNDRWYTYLRSLGLRGSLNDMMKRVFCNSMIEGDPAGFSLPESAWILATGSWDDAGTWQDNEVWVD